MTHFRRAPANDAVSSSASCSICVIRVSSRLATMPIVTVKTDAASRPSPPANYGRPVKLGPERAEAIRSGDQLEAARALSDALDLTCAVDLRQERGKRITATDSVTGGLE